MNDDERAAQQKHSDQVRFTREFSKALGVPFSTARNVLRDFDRAATNRQRQADAVAQQRVPKVTSELTQMNPIPRTPEQSGNEREKPASAAGTPVTIALSVNGQPGYYVSLASVPPILL